MPRLLRRESTVASEGPRLTTLTWLLILLLVAITEYTIGGWVANYGADRDVVSHVSFAGTIVSIILAVLAIVYSYYQNFSQQRDSASIAFQIDELRKVLEGIRGSERTLSVELGRFEDLSRKMDRTISIGRASKRAVEALASRLDELKETSDSEETVQSQANQPHGLDPSAIAQTLLRSPRITSLASLYVIYLGARDHLTTREAAEKYVLPATKKKSDNDSLAHWADGIYTGCWHLLNALGVLEIEESTPARFVRLDPAYEEAFLARLPDFEAETDSKIIDLASIHEIENKPAEQAKLPSE